MWIPISNTTDESFHAAALKSECLLGAKHALPSADHSLASDLDSQEVGAVFPHLQMRKPGQGAVKLLRAKACKWEAGTPAQQVGPALFTPSLLWLDWHLLVNLTQNNA